MNIIFFTGKGGVGKSTLSAAAAWQLSQRYRVLIVSLDPAHNLGDIFGVSIGDKTVRFNETLRLREIDLQQLSRAYLKREMDVLKGTYRYLQTVNLDRYFSVLKYSPGIEEYALLTSIEDTIRTENDFDYVVFDTPPTGLTLRFLALPRVTVTWIERLSEIRRTILEKRYTIHRLRGALDNEETVLDYREEDDEALKRLNSLSENYETLNTRLRGTDCAVVVVYNPDFLSLKESQRLIQGLNDLNLPLRLLINNKVGTNQTEMADHVDDVMAGYSPGVPMKRVSLYEAPAEGKETGPYDIPEDLASEFG
jgi:arsenite-transporting ATPase